MPSGYSGKPLAEKLGIKPDTRVCALGPPENYRAMLGVLPENVTWETELGAGQCDLIHFFTSSASELRTLCPDIKKKLPKDGVLWISWPKQASGVATDLKESTVMEIGLAGGLVDVKVAAIDETWSGLKFVYRVKDR
jgi:hypothetical protein